MDRYVVLGLVAAAGVVLVVVGMTVSLRRRRRAQSHLDAAFVPVPPTLSPALVVTPVLHVATTRAGDPYERISAGGLGFRSRGAVSVHPEGVLLSLDGVGERFVPAATIRGAGRATWTLDRTVEPDGLVLLGWTLGSDEVDTYFRAEDPDSLVRALLDLTPTSPTDTPRTDTPASQEAP